MDTLAQDRALAAAPMRDPPPMPDVPPVREPTSVPEQPPGRDPVPVPDIPPVPDPKPEPGLPPPDPDPTPGPVGDPAPEPGKARAASAAAHARLPQLDGLRGAAILMVVLGHYFVPAANSAAAAAAAGQPHAAWLIGSWFRLGWSGVDLFFVLSGFLIGGILLEARDAPNYFRAFYARRFLRIVPAYFAWIAGYALVALAAVALWHARATRDFVELPGWQLAAQFFFLQTFAGHFRSVLAGKWFVPSWSLAVEEQFYLLAPLCVRRLSRRALALLLGGVIVAAPLARAALLLHGAASPWTAYILLPCRADALAMGMLVALFWSDARCRAWLSWHRIVLFAALGSLYEGMARLFIWNSDPLSRFTEVGGLTWVAAFYAALLLVLVAEPSGPLAWLMRRSWLRELGRVSYVMYLSHLAVFTMVAAVVDLALRQIPMLGAPLMFAAAARLAPWHEAIAAVIAAAATYALARASFAWLERPMLARGKSFAYAAAPPTPTPLPQPRSAPAPAWAAKSRLSF